MVAFCHERRGRAGGTRPLAPESALEPCVTVLPDAGALFMNFLLFCEPASSFFLLPWWLSGKESACRCRRCGFDPWVGKIPWRRKWPPTAVFFAWKTPWTEEPGGLQFHGVAKRVGYDLVSEPACTVLSCFNSGETAACVHGLHTVVSTNSFSQKCEAMCVENI